MFFQYIIYKTRVQPHKINKLLFYTQGLRYLCINEKDNIDYRRAKIRQEHIRRTARIKHV